MSAYTIYKELFPPQAVEHVKRAHFTSPDKINLIVAKSSLLQVYDFVEFTPSVDGFMHDATNGVIEADGEETGEVEEDDTEAQERFHGQDEQVSLLSSLAPSLGRPAAYGLYAGSGVSKASTIGKKYIGNKLRTTRTRCSVQIKWKCRDNGSYSYMFSTGKARLR